MSSRSQRDVTAEASLPGLASGPRKYVPVRRIGIGGMAEVFLARQYGEGGFEKQVVLKRPLPEHAADRGLVARLLREARLVAKLDHPGIAAVYEVGRDEEGVFIAMEYVDGPDLRAMIREARERGRRPTLPEVVSIAADLAAALDHAHRKCDEDGTPLGIVHRDVSPSNILVRTDGRVKLLDFGIAKDQSGPTLTGSSELVGKIVYMSPEQIMRWKLDARSDLFALGVVLWELCALRRPFPDADHVGLLRNIPVVDVPSILELRPDLPPEFDAVLRRLLARRREDRWPDAQQLRVELLALAAAHRFTPSHECVAPLVQELFPDEGTRSELARAHVVATELAATDTLSGGPTRPVSTHARRRRNRALASLGVIGVLAGGAFVLAPRSPAARHEVTPVEPAATAPAAPIVAAPPTTERVPAAELNDATTTKRSMTSRSRKPSRPHTKRKSKPNPKPELDPVLPPGFQ